MGVMTVAVIPTSVATRDSLELSTLWKTVPNSQTTPAAMTNAPSSAKGALIQGLRVAPMREKINPKPPNAVINAVMVVGLKGDRPGMPVSWKPASA